MDGFAHLQEELNALLGIQLQAHQLQAAHRYADLLVEWNQKINLTAITSPEDIRKKHFLDSLSCDLVFRGSSPGRLIDVGTGAGFPGLPLKILYPEMQLTLVESVAKKTSFLSVIVQELGLKAVEIVTNRAEAVGQDPAHREKYDWAVARALAGLPVLVEYLLPLVKVGGFVLAQKGETALEELKEAHKALGILGGKAREPIPVSLPGLPDRRYLVLIEKTRPTPAQFPRRVGLPGKRPLR